MSLVRAILLVCVFAMQTHAFAKSYNDITLDARLRIIKHEITDADVLALVADFPNWCDSHGRYTPSLQGLIWELEEILTPWMTATANQEFQLAVGKTGASLKGPIVFPKQTESHWIATHQSPYDFYASNNGVLPEEVDITIVGAGVTGSAVAFYLAPYVARGEVSVAIIEGKQGPARGASGENGGNREIYAKSFVYQYEGLTWERFKFLSLTYKGYPKDFLWHWAEEQAVQLMLNGMENEQRIFEIVREGKIDADLVNKGSVTFVDKPSDIVAFLRDIELAKRLEIPMEMWSGDRTLMESGVEAPLGSRFTPNDGNFNSRKLVDGMLRYALGAGIQFFTNTSLLENGIDTSTPAGQPVRLNLNRGLLKSKQVFLATDAYTPAYLPQMSNLIMPYQSVVQIYPHTLRRLNGMTGESHNGDSYEMFPLGAQYTDEFGIPRGVFLPGGGTDIAVLLDYLNDLKLPESTQREFVEWLNTRFPHMANRPAAGASTGVFGFSPDRMAIAGRLLRDPRVRGFLATQGYGNSMFALAAMVAAEELMQTVRAGRLKEKYYPEKYFSSERFCNEWLEGHLAEYQRK